MSEFVGPTYVVAELGPSSAGLSAETTPARRLLEILVRLKIAPNIRSPSAFAAV